MNLKTKFIKFSSTAREWLIALTILFILSMYAGIIIVCKREDSGVYSFEANICVISLLLCLANLLSCLTVWVMSEKNLNYKLQITVLGFLPFLLLKGCVILLAALGYHLRG